MRIAYLKDLPWSRWTREERFFCSILYSHAHSDAAGFAAWLIETSGLNLDAKGDWDLGYEVCFYRDYLWQIGASARLVKLPPKRTFDLCLFGERAIIVIEAKVCEAFDSAQNEDFRRDRDLIKKVLGRTDLEVRIVALASSKYFANAAKFGRPNTLEVFDGDVSWAKVAERYRDDLLVRADGMYKMERGKSVGAV